MTRKWILVLAVLAIIGIVAILGALGVRDTQSHETAINTPEVNQVSYLDSQPQYIKDLIWCESRGNPYAVGDKGKSFGSLQFQEPTFWVYNELYKILPDLERHEVPNIVYDEFVQVELAKKILAENGGWRNWLNCAKMTGLNDLARK